MPKLSSQSLSKRFPCYQCLKSFRTRQGLSGHVRFKHGLAGGTQVLIHNATPTEEFALDLDDIIGMRQEWLRAAKIVGFSKEEIEAHANILQEWNQVSTLCKGVGAKLDKSDFKQYLVVSLALAYSLEHHRQKLIHSLDSLRYADESPR